MYVFTKSHGPVRGLGAVPSDKSSFRALIDSYYAEALKSNSCAKMAAMAAVAKAASGMPKENPPPWGPDAIKDFMADNAAAMAKPCEGWIEPGSEGPGYKYTPPGGGSGERSVIDATRRTEDYYSPITGRPVPSIGRTMPSAIRSMTSFPALARAQATLAPSLIRSAVDARRFMEGNAPPAAPPTEETFLGKYGFYVAGAVMVAIGVGAYLYEKRGGR